MNGVLRGWLMACWLLVCGLGLSACGGGGGSEAAGAATVQRLELSTSNVSLARGTTQQVIATALYSDGTKRDVTAATAWSSSDSTVAGINAGLLSAVAPGSVLITARYSGFAATAAVTVTPAVIVGLQLTPPTATVPVGVSRQYVATATFSDQTTQDVTTSAIWSTGNNTIATVSTGSGGGLALGRAIGTTSVAASFQGYSASAQITVTAATLSRIDVTPASVQLIKGRSQQLSASAVFTDGTSQDVTSQATWSSADASSVTVSNSSGSQGLATAVGSPANGQPVAVSASFSGLSGSASVGVTAAVVTQIQVTPASASVPRGLTQAYSATATLSDGSTQDVTTAAIWSSSNTSIAVVSNTSGSNGVATALNIGTATIAASYQGFSAGGQITVGNPTVTGMSVLPPNVSIPTGFTQQYRAYLQYSDLTVQEVTANATWASSSPAVATVNNGSANQPGLATSLAPGQTQISAAYSGYSGSATLTVTSAVLSSIQVTPASASIPRGTTQAFVATGVYSDQTTQDITASVTWSSSDTTIATISNTSPVNGVATGIGLGTVSIRAQLQGITGSATLTVTSATLSRVDVAPSNTSVPVGLTQAFTATAVYTDASVQDVTALSTWTSSNTSVATISNASDSIGVATGVALGSTTITASYGGLSGTAALTVSGAVLSTIELSPVGYTLPKGFRRGYRATGIYSDGSKSDVTTTVVWTSSAPAIATVSNASGNNGLVTGVAAGSTTLTAALRGVQASLSLTVTAATLSLIDVQPANPSVQTGTRKSFSAAGVFSDSTTLDLTTQVSWTSSNTSVATISSSGVAVTAGAGTTTIAAVLAGKTGTSAMTVRNVSLQSIQVSAVSETLPVGQSEPFQAIGVYSDGSTADLSTQVTWSSSDATIATINTGSGNGNGVASAQAPGTATISASYSGLAGSTLLSVSAASLQSLTITPVDPTIPAGVRTSFKAFGVYSDNTVLDLTNAVTWRSSDTTAVNVSNDPSASGLALTLAAGGSTLSVQYGGVSANSVITVSSATLSSIQIQPTAPGVVAGFTLPLQAIGVYSDGSQLDLTAQLTWVSGNTAIAQVSNAAGSQGLVYGRSAGTTSITATDPASGVAGNTAFTTSSAVLQSISVAPRNTGLTALPAGYSAPFVATGQYSDGSKAILTTVVSWTSQDPTIAAVSSASGSQGLVSGVSAGNTTIVATLGSISGSAAVTISTATLSTIAVTPLNATIPAGTSLQFRASGSFSDSTLLDLTTQVTWTSSNPAAVSISNSPGTQGLATARVLPVGTAVITASVAGKSGSALAQVN